MAPAVVERHPLRRAAVKAAHGVLPQQPRQQAAGRVLANAVAHIPIGGTARLG